MQLITGKNKMSTETNQDYDLIDIKEVKATIDISTATIYRMMREGTCSGLIQQDTFLREY